MRADVEGSRVALIGEALRRRLGHVRAAADRLESFAFDERNPGGVPDPPDLSDDALRDVLLRALGRLADPLNYAILRRLCDGDVALADLAIGCGLPRLAAWERVSDLIQVGLAARGDRSDIAVTDGGRAMVDFVEQSVDAGRSEA